jgi:hypothetical protein
MIALLRKDALWLLAFAGVATFIALIVIVGLGGTAIWYRPDHDFGVASLFFHSIAASLLGLFSGLFEDVARTREYLVHRPVSLGRLFWTRQLGCALVVLGWIVVVPALHLAGTLAFSEASGLVDAARFWTFVNHGAVGFAFLGIGLFSAALARRPALAIFVAAPLTLGLVIFLALSLYGDTPSALIFHGQGAMGLAMGVLLAAAALSLEREGRDLDRPAAGARLVAAAGTLVVLSLAGAAFLNIVQKDARSDILYRYPKIAQRPDGSRLLVVERDFAGRLVPVDDSHHRIEGAVEGVDVLFEPRAFRSPPRNEPFAARGKLVRGMRYERVGCSVAAYCYVASDGLLHLYRFDSEGPALALHVGKETGGRFSPRAQVLGWWSRVALIGDPEDGGVWRYDLDSGGPAFTRVVLPGDDRFVDNLSAAISRSRQAMHEASFSGLVVVRGERGVYTTEPSGFAPASPAIARIVEQLARQSRSTVEIEVSGPVTFRATVPASGQAATSHDYRPRTGRERALYVEMMGLSVLRAPVLALASLAAPRPARLDSPSRDGAWILVDPMIVLGATGVLVVQLLIGGALAAVALRRLTRLGASRGRRAFWTALVFLFGPLAFFVYRACENARAWQPLEAAEPVPLLIASAA